MASLEAHEKLEEESSGLHFYTRPKPLHTSIALHCMFKSTIRYFLSLLISLHHLPTKNKNV